MQVKHVVPLESDDERAEKMKRAKKRRKKGERFGSKSHGSRLAAMNAALVAAVSTAAQRERGMLDAGAGSEAEQYWWRKDELSVAVGLGTEVQLEVEA